jgi:hypothetical protein
MLDHKEVGLYGSRDEETAKNSQLIVFTNLLCTMQQGIAWAEEAHFYAVSMLRCINSITV